MVKVEHMLSSRVSDWKANLTDKTRQKDAERLRQLQDAAWLLGSGLLPVFEDVAQTFHNRDPHVYITTPTGNPRDVMRLELLLDPKNERGGVSYRAISAIVKDDHAVIRQGDRARIPIPFNSSIGEIELRRKSDGHVNMELARKLVLQAASSPDNPHLRTHPESKPRTLLKRLRGGNKTIEIHTT